MTKTVISPTRKLEFAHYRKLRAPSAEVFSHFGYTLQNELLDLPRSEKLADIENLKEILKANACGIDLKTENTARQFMIAPVASEVLRQTKAKLRAAYRLEIHSQLRGYFSYLFSQNGNLLLIESAGLEKRRRNTGKVTKTSFIESGMNKSFTQLGIELIALDQAEETAKPFIYGLISTGNTWQFSILDRKEKLIRLDLRTFDIFADIAELIRIIIGILERK